MTLSAYDAAIFILVVCGGSILVLPHLIQSARTRIEFIRVARTASSDFYVIAERLLTDPATPEPLKDMVYDMAIAVTDERVGRKAVELLIRSVAEIKHKGRIPKPKQELLNELNELRRTRGDLYDAFHEALRAAMATILVVHATQIDRPKVTFGYDAVGGTYSKILSLAQTIDNAIAGWRGRDDDDHKAAACA